MSGWSARTDADSDRAGVAIGSGIGERNARRADTPLENHTHIPEYVHTHTHTHRLTADCGATRTTTVVVVVGGGAGASLVFSKRGGW